MYTALSCASIVRAHFKDLCAESELFELAPAQATPVNSSSAASSSSSSSSS